MVRVKYYCTESESFDSRQVPGFKRACKQCEHRFYCLTSRLIRNGSLFGCGNRQMIAMAGDGWTGYAGWRLGWEGQHEKVAANLHKKELKQIEAKFGIDFRYCDGR